MKTVISAAVAVTFATVLTGCVTTQGEFSHIRTDDGKCFTCINNPVTGEPWNHDGPGVAPLGSPETKEEVVAEREKVKASTAGQPPQYDIEKRIFTVDKNVDMAYVRIKEEFNFYSLEQVKAELGEDAWAVIQSQTWKYEALPSVFYKMRGYRKHDDISLTIDTEVEKRTDQTSRITLRYWLPEGTGNDSKKLYGDGLKDRIIDAIAGRD